MTRKTIAALLLAAALPTMVMAMPEGSMGTMDHMGRMGMEDGGHHKGGHLFKELNLTPEQRQEMQRLMGEHMRSRHEIVERYLDKLPAAERKAMQDEIKARHEESYKAMRALLKPEQQKRFDEMHQQMQEKQAEWDEFQKWKAEHGKKN